jgi:hypothetical protein
VAVHDADGQLTYTDVPEGRQDLLVEAIPVGSESRGGAILPLEVGEPRFGHDAELRVWTNLRLGFDPDPVAKCKCESSRAAPCVRP